MGNQESKRKEDIEIEIHKCFTILLNEITGIVYPQRYYYSNHIQNHETIIKNIRTAYKLSTSTKISDLEKINNEFLPHNLEMINKLLLYNNMDVDMTRYRKNKKNSINEINKISFLIKRLIMLYASNNDKIVNLRNEVARLTEENQRLTNISLEQEANKPPLASAPPLFEKN